MGGSRRPTVPQTCPTGCCSQEGSWRGGPREAGEAVPQGPITLGCCWGEDKHSLVGRDVVAGETTSKGRKDTGRVRPTQKT